MLHLSSQESIKHAEPDEQDSGNKKYLTQWETVGDLGYTASGPSSKPLPSKIYTLNWFQQRIVFRIQPQEIDELYEFPGSPGSQFLNELKQFLENGKKYAEFGFSHQRGFGLYGKAGGGKTSLVQEAMRIMLEMKGVVILGNIDPNTLKLGLDQLRSVEPERYVMVVLEDLDSILKEYGEPQFLALLDGESKIDRCVFIATTNYPDLLDDRIKNRRRRFDRWFEIDLLNAEQRKVYFTKKLGELPIVEDLVRLSEGMTLGDMAEIIISIQCLGLDKDEVISNIRKSIAGKTFSSSKREVGF